MGAPATLTDRAAGQPAGFWGAIASTACTSSSVRTQSAALALAQTCSGLVAPSDDRNDGRLGRQPGNGQLQEGVAMSAREQLELVDNVHRRSGQKRRWRSAGMPAKACPVGGASPRLYFPDKTPDRER